MYDTVEVLHVPLIKHCAVAQSLQQRHDAGMLHNMQGAVWGAHSLM